jgi:Glycosyltransferase family 87/WD40-like Beta Propeller Repeat
MTLPSLDRPVLNSEQVGEARSGVAAGLWMRRGEWVLLVVMAAYFFVHALPAAWKTLNTDFPNYYLTARLAREGVDTSRVYEWVWLQRQKDHREIDQAVVGLVPITPVSTLAVWPLTGMQPLVAKRVWLLLNMAMLVGVAVLLRGMTRLPWRRIALVAALSVPLEKNFLYGQYYVLLLFVLTLACWCYVRQRRFAAGVLVGVGFGLKLFPVLYLGYFLRKRDWRALAGGVVGCVGSAVISVAVFGWQVNRVLVVQVLPWALRGEGMDPYSPSTASVATLLHRLFVYEPQWNPHPVVRAAWMLAVLLPVLQTVVFAPALLLARPGDERPGRLELEWSAVLIGSLAISTLPAGYHFTLLILPVCLMWRAVEEWGGVAAGALLLGLYAAIGFPGWQRIGAAMPWTVLSVPRLYVVMALCGLSYWMLWVGRRKNVGRWSVGWETRVWVGLFAVWTVFGIVAGVRHQRGLYADYAGRLDAGGEVLQMERPVVQGERVLATAMLRDGYRTAVRAGEGVRFDGGEVDELGVAADAAGRWTERVGGESRIVSGDAEIGGEAPVVSADGRWLGFVREERGRGGFWVRALDGTGGAERRVTPEEFNVLEGSFGRDGAVVFSAMRDGGRPGLFVVGGDGVVRALDGVEARYPAVSPDGRWLAYSRLQGGNWHLWLRDLESGTSRRLTDADCNNMEPAWTVDSKSVVYASDCGRALWFTMLSRRRVVP